MLQHLLQHPLLLLPPPQTFLPLDLRVKKTRALRRRLSKEQVGRPTAQSKYLSLPFTNQSHSNNAIGPNNCTLHCVCCHVRLQHIIVLDYLLLDACSCKAALQQRHCLAA